MRGQDVPFKWTQRWNTRSGWGGRLLQDMKRTTDSAVNLETATLKRKWSTRVSDKLFLGCVWIAVSLAYPFCRALDYCRTRYGSRSDAFGDLAATLRPGYATHREISLCD